MRFRHLLIAGLLVLGFWPSAGWLWLHHQSDHLTAQMNTWATEHLAHLNESHRQPVEFTYRPRLLPQFTLQNSEFMLPVTAEPITIVSATLHARWYSLWVFRWLPQRLDIHQAHLLQPMAEDSQLTAADLWAILDGLPELESVFQVLPSMDVQQLNLTLYDPMTANLVDASIQAFVRRSKSNDYRLSSVVDIQGDGWVEHGFGELQAEWHLLADASSAASIHLQRVNAKLEVHSATRTYGIYRWDAHLEQVRVNPLARTFAAKEFSFSHGAAAGRAETEPHEIGERTAWLSMTGGNESADWSAEILRRANVVRPRSAWINDVIWSLQYEQWTPDSLSEHSIGRTEIGWQATLNHPHLARVLVQLNTPANSNRLIGTPSLTQWRAEPANVAIDITTTERNYVLRGRANAASNVDQHQLQLNNMALEEVFGRDAYWLYGHLYATPEGLSIDDLIGPERGTEANPQVEFPAWADCLGLTEQTMVSQILHCAAQYRASMEQAQ